MWRFTFIRTQIAPPESSLGPQPSLTTSQSHKRHVLSRSLVGKQLYWIVIVSKLEVGLAGPIRAWRKKTSRPSQWLGIRIVKTPKISFYQFWVTRMSSIDLSSHLVKEQKVTQLRKSCSSNNRMAVKQMSDNRELFQREMAFVGPSHEQMSTLS